MTIAELMKRRLVKWEVLQDCFGTTLSSLPEMKMHGSKLLWVESSRCCHFMSFLLLLRMDAPHCDVMVHCLIARLLMLETFNPVSWSKWGCRSQIRGISSWMLIWPEVLRQLRTWNALPEKAQVILKPIQSFVGNNENRDLGWSLMQPDARGFRQSTGCSPSTKHRVPTKGWSSGRVAKDSYRSSQNTRIQTRPWREAGVQLFAKSDVAEAGGHQEAEEWEVSRHRQESAWHELLGQFLITSLKNGCLHFWSCHIETW